MACVLYVNKCYCNCEIVLIYMPIVLSNIVWYFDMELTLVMMTQRHFNYSNNPHELVYLEGAWFFKIMFSPF